MVDDEFIIAQYLAKKKAREAAITLADLGVAIKPVTIVLEAKNDSARGKVAKKPKKILTVDLQMNQVETGKRSGIAQQLSQKVSEAKVQRKTLLDKK